MAGMPVIRTAYVRLVMTDLKVLVPLSILIAGFFFVLSFEIEEFRETEARLKVGAKIGAKCASAGALRRLRTRQRRRESV